MLAILGAFLVSLAAYGVGALIERHVGNRPSSNADIAKKLDEVVGLLKDQK